VLGLAWLTAGKEGEAGEWFDQAWTYTKQIVPLLLGGVLVAGFLLGRPGHEGLIPSEWISGLVGCAPQILHPGRTDDFAGPSLSCGMIVT
jgi:hypothetical protein